MSKNKLQKLDVNGDMPMEETICVFRSNKLGIIILIIGYIKWDKSKFIIKQYGTDVTFTVSNFDAYQYILNEKCGFLFVK